MATPEEVQLQDQLNDELRVTNNTLTSIANNLNEQFKLQQKINKEVDKTANDYYKDIARSLKMSAKEVFTIAENQEALSRGAIRSKDIQAQITKSLREQNKATETFKLLEQQIGSLTKEEAQWRQDALQASKDQVDTLKAQFDEAKKIEKTAGLTAKIFEGLKDIPFVNKLIDAEKITEAIYENAAKNKSAWKAFGAGLSATFSQITSKLKDPLVVLGLTFTLYKKIYDLTKEHDELLTKTGRQLAINKEQVQGMYENYFKYSTTAHDAFVTGERLLKSQLELNEALGTMVDYGAQSADTFARLTHFYGLSAEQAGKLEELGREQGKTSADILNSTIKTAAQQKLQFGGAISYQNVLKKVSGVSGEILTKFKGNTDALVAAVMQADRLGLTLEQVDKIGESLLNFESSIENELKAELLTGKAINLEKARSAALSGNTADLTKEIVKQVGSMHEFEKMNVIQRKAYAEAFGMSVSEMGDMLRKQEFEAQLGDKIKASAEEQLKYAQEHGIAMSDAIKQSLEQRSLAEEQKEIFDKLRDIIRKITSGPMLQFFHLIEKSLHGVTKIIEGFGKITGGALGSALGAAILGLPAALAVFRLGSSLFMPKPTGRGNDPIAMYQVGGPMGAGGAKNFVPGLGFTGGTLPGGIRQNSAGRYIGADGRFVSGEAVTAAQTQQRGMAMRNMKIGGGLAIGGMALSGIASGMEEGGGKQAMGVLGHTASYAGMGMMFGPWGAAIGGLVGLGMGLFSLSKENEERRKQEAEQAKAAQQATADALEALSVRPINLNMNNQTISNWNTYSQQNGANPKLA